MQNDLRRRIPHATTIEKKRVSALEALNEAYHYQRPSAFSRGLRLELGPISVLLISGTASVGPNGETLHVGDFRAQTRRTFANIAALLYLVLSAPLSYAARRLELWRARATA